MGDNFPQGLEPSMRLEMPGLLDPWRVMQGAIGEQKSRLTSPEKRVPHCHCGTQSQRGGEEGPSPTFLVSLSDFKLSGDRCGKPQGPRRDGVPRAGIPAAQVGTRPSSPKCPGRARSPSPQVTARHLPSAVRRGRAVIGGHAGASPAGVLGHVTSAPWLRESGAAAWDRRGVSIRS